MSDTVPATRFLSWTIHDAIVFKCQLNIRTQEVLLVRYRNCIKIGVKRIGTYFKSLLRSVIFGYATGRPTGYNSFGSFTVEWTSLTSFSSKVNLRQLTVTK